MEAPGFHLTRGFRCVAVRRGRARTRCSVRKMTNMHANERDRVILSLLDEHGFVSLRDLTQWVDTSTATLRRDLERLQMSGKLTRVRGGVQSANGVDRNGDSPLRGVPFHENVNLHRSAKEAIGKAAAQLCRPGDAVIIDGGSTTLQMCSHLEPLRLQVFTNSLHIVSALLPQQHTRVAIPGGVVFREQNIILHPFDDTTTYRFHASFMFVGAAAVTRYGLMKNDVMQVQAERKLLALAEKVVALVDSSKFSASAAHSVCELNRVHTLITDGGLDQASSKMLKSHNIEVITVDAGRRRR
jgi:DeoR family transcriptional regulator, ulaG and ulaABCDEF operon transcriptional repressor